MTTRQPGTEAAQQGVPSRALPIGTRLHGDFDVIGVIHDGEYGISYLASDVTQRRHVVIKEYLPAMLATRAIHTSTEVSAKSPQQVHAFEEGLKSFIHEARLLVAFDTPSLVSVLRLWKQNGTAYMVLQKIDGQTLRHLVADRGGPPEEAEVRQWLGRLLGALEILHGARCVHGNITPDSIMIGAGGPVLLGFGGGRHAIGRALREPNVALEPGYAAVEQYGNDPAAAQGAWTDLYALGSVVYAALTYRAPMAAPERRLHDPLIPLRELAAGRFSPSLVEAVDAALALWPGERPQDVAAFRALLDPVVSAPASRPVPQVQRHPQPQPQPQPKAQSQPQPRQQPQPVAPAPIPIDFSAISALAARPPTAARAPTPTLSTPSLSQAQTSAASNSSKVMRVAVTAVCTIAFGTLGFLAMRPTDGLSPPHIAPDFAEPLNLPPTSAGPSQTNATPADPSAAGAPEPSATETAPTPRAPTSASTTAAPAAESVAPAPQSSRPLPKRARAASAPGLSPQEVSEAVHRARCNELLQRGSLANLTRAETATLRRDCP